MRLWRDFSNSLLVLACLAVPIHAEEQMDFIVGVVNDEVILNSQVQRELEIVRRRLANNKQPEPSRALLLEAIIKRLVEHKLQLQRARRVIKPIPAARVDNVIRSILESNKISVDDLLQIEGVTRSQLRRRIEEDILINDALEWDNSNDTTLTQAEVNEALRSRLRDGDRREYLVEHVVLRTDQRTLADEFRVLENDAFVARAREVSLVPEVSLSWRLPGDLPAGYAAVVSELLPGTNSQVLEMVGKLHVVRLVARRLLVPGQTRSGKIKVKMLRTASATQEELVTARNEIANGNEDFASVAATLGGEVVVEESAVADLPPTVSQGLRLRVGELDGPFALADGGYVLVLVLDVQVSLYGDQRVRQEMVSVLYNQRLEQVRQKWIENLSSRGTIEIFRDPL